MKNITQNLSKQITDKYYQTYESDLLKRIADLCCQASEEIFEDDRTMEILNTCDKLQDLIDEYLGN